MNLPQRESSPPPPPPPPTPRLGFTIQRKLVWQIEELRENGETVSDAAMQQTTTRTNFSTVDSEFGDDFAVFPTFVPTDTLKHLNSLWTALHDSWSIADDVHLPYSISSFPNNFDL